MEQTAKPTFFDLPAELRNHIFELLVFHHDTNGTISPVIPTSRCAALIDGTRYVISNGYPQFEIDTRTTNDPRERQNLTDDKLRQVEAFKMTSNSISNHYCTPMCLLQPEISKVNRRMREEALTVFYGMNRIHFEMGNFEVTASGGQLRTRDSWSPATWWRAVGDTNLRRCGRLSIVCHPSIPGATATTKSHVMIDYSKHGKHAVHITTVDPLLCDAAESRSLVPRPGRSAFENYRIQKRQRSPDWERTVSANFDVIKESGLHVRVLEHLIIALEPCDVEYLVDHSSLDSALQIGVVMDGRGERALRWRPF